MAGSEPTKAGEFWMACRVCLSSFQLSFSVNSVRGNAPRGFAAPPMTTLADFSLRKCRELTTVSRIFSSRTCSPLNFGPHVPMPANHLWCFGHRPLLSLNVGLNGLNLDCLHRRLPRRIERRGNR